MEKTLIAFFLCVLLISCQKESLGKEFERSGEALEVFHATEEDYRLIKKDWFVEHLDSAQAVLLEDEISFEFTLKKRDRKDVEQLVKLLQKGFLYYLGLPMTDMPFQEHPLIQSIHQKKGNIVLRVYLKDQLIHYEAYDFLKDNLLFERHSLIIEPSWEISN